EDGIRDGHVTGVQTCALPILKAAAEMVKKFAGATPAEQKSKLTPLGRKETVNGMPTDVFTTDTAAGKATYYIASNYPDAAAIMKIGRASCRKEGKATCWCSAY